MPIWVELTILMLACYCAGLALGWLIWASEMASPKLSGSDTPETDEDI